MKNLIQSDADVLTLTNNTGSAISSGDAVVFGNRVGVAVTDIAAAASGAVSFRGVYQFNKVVGETYAQGDNVYWNATLSKITEVTDAGVYVGKVVAAAAAAGTTANVRLADPGPSAAIGEGKRLAFHEQFLGYMGDVALAPGNWKVTDTSAAGAPTYAQTNDVHGGAFEITLAADDEAENVCLDWGDKLSLDKRQGLIFECEVTFNAIPIANARLCLGLATARNDTPLSIAGHVLFACVANGAVLVYSDDGTTAINDADTGIVVANGETHTFRIEISSTAAVKVYVDDVDLTATALAAATGPPTAFDISAAANYFLQPYFQVQKASGVGVTSIEVKDVKIWADT